MLTINAAGKTANEAVSLIQEALSANADEDIKILIDGPSVWPDIKRYLDAQGFKDVMLEDDDGALYIMVHPSDKTQQSAPEPEPEHQPERTAPPIPMIEPKTTAVLISGENKQYRADFLKKFTASLLTSRIKPSVIALMNDSVKLAAYDSQTCDTLKRLANSGVTVLLSESCTDRLGLSESIGVGELADMSEVIERVFACERIVSV